MRAAWPLVGRDEEAAFLANAIDSTAVSGCVLSGVAGVGKTRLAREVVDRARDAGRDTEWLVATSGTRAISLGALVPALGSPPPPDSQGELLHWAGRQLAARDGLVLCVDDAHLLDDTSAALLLQLAARQQVFVVATVRSGEYCPNSITGLWKDGLAERLEIVPLSKMEVAILAREFLDADLTPDAAELLFELSGGVPLFLRELLIAGLSEGSIVETADGCKAWDGPLVPTARLNELVAARVDGLPSAHRHAMNLIALGEPLDIEIAERALGHDVLVELEERDVLTTEPSTATTVAPRVRVAHPLYSEVLRERISIPVRRHLYQHLADAAMQCIPADVDLDAVPDDDLLRISSWRLDSHDPGDTGFLITAGDRALRVFDTSLAERLGRAAVASGAGAEGGLLVAEALYYGNRWEEAAEALDALTNADIDDDTRARAAIQRSSLLIWSTGQPDEAHDLLTDMAGKLSDQTVRAEVEAERIWPLVVSNRLEESMAVARPFVASDAIDARARTRALPPAILAYAISGATDVAQEVAAQVAAIAPRVDRAAPTTQGNLLAAVGLALWLGGRLGEAEVLLDAISVEDAGVSDDAHGLLALAKGKVALEQGHVLRAIEELRRAVDALLLTEVSLSLPWAYYAYARALALRGDGDAADQALADGDSHREGREAVKLSEPDRLMAQASIAECRVPGDGVPRFRELSEHFEAWGALPYALIALTDKVTYGGCTTDDQVRAAQLAERCQGRLVPVLARLVDALLVRDPDLLIATADTCESIRMDRYAAEAALIAADRYDARQQTGSALAARQRAADCLARCGPMKTPILTNYGGDAPLAMLTKREQEIARLVGSGLTNREIAERVHVSNRTVDNHVQHIFTKLGIHNREELSSLA